MSIPAEQIDPFTRKFGGKLAKRIESKARGRTVKTTPPSTGPPLAETPMSDGGLPNSDAWMQGLRDYFRRRHPCLQSFCSRRAKRRSICAAPNGHWSGTGSLATARRL
jgi:hypothetical protein